MIDRIFYHGTQQASACSIMRQGFRVGEETMGRNLGPGLYLTPRVGFAAVWGPVVIRCSLRPGTRILWHTPVDEHTITYLKNEFGVGITEPTFDRVIPRNKQLTRSEVAQLWNYLMAHHYLKPRPSRRDLFPKLAHNFPFIYRHLKRHGYAGVGMLDEEWPEMFLFNPSNARPLSAHSYTSTGWHVTWERENVILSEPLTLAQLCATEEQKPYAREGE
jgi:hypothetical protein